MVKIIIVYYSESDNTKKMAEIVCDAVKKEEVDVELKNVENIDVNELLAVDGIIIGSPTYYGTMAWQIKKLLDESVKFHGKLNGKVGAAFTSSANIGGGNETTIMDILKAMLIHGMIIQGEPSGGHYGPVAIGTPDESAKDNCIRLGEKVARLVKRLKID